MVSVLLLVLLLLRPPTALMCFTPLVVPHPWFAKPPLAVQDNSSMKPPLTPPQYAERAAALPTTTSALIAMEPKPKTALYAKNALVPLEIS